MSDGHCIARSLSLSECLNEWTTQPTGTLGFNHLLMAADAELALAPLADVYLGKAYGLVLFVCLTLLAAQREAPTRGYLSLTALGLEAPPWMRLKIYMRCFKV